MIDLNQAPKQGRVLAYTSKEVVYDGYELKDGKLVLRSGRSLSWSEVYELHLFDKDEEFRASKKGEEWDIRTLSVKEEANTNDDYFIFSEPQFVQERFWVEQNEKIVVNNRFSFDQQGFLRLLDYRLAME